MSQPLALAALVLNYRRADLTARCVASLSDPIQRIYVIDNSDDHWEAAQLASCLRSTRTDAPPVRILTPPVNLGFARGMSFGLEAARSEQAWDAYWIMNNDATAGPDLVGSMIAAFEAHGRHALVAPRASREGVASKLWYQRLLGLVLTRPMWGAFPYLNGACLLIPASAAAPHLFDTDFFLYGEDVELSWRLSRLGFPLVEVDAGYDHQGQAATRNGSLFYEFHIVRGHLLLARKLATHRGERVLFLLGRILSLPARACVRSLRYRSLIPWQGLIRAWFTPGRKLDPPRIHPDASP